MLSSPKDAAGSSFQRPKRATLFSFPPTQRSGLLDSTASATRSANQRVNLQQSFQALLGSLDNGLDPDPVA